MPSPLSRRTFLVMGGGVSAAVALPDLIGRIPDAAAAVPTGSDSPEARFYYRLLLRHTRWLETLWDDAVGHYPLTDYNFVSVLGNAVLLTMGQYDAELSGIDRDTLLDHTVRTIEHAAVTNFYATGAEWGGGGYAWGGKIFWDGTMESYFVAAARLLWSRLSQQARDAVDAIAIGGADYVVSLGATEDPRSGGWSSNGLLGGWKNDSKIEEMGAKSMPLATGLAYFPNHPSAPAWREWLTRWMSNMTGLPSADRHNSTKLDGKPVSWWNTAQNLYDDYLVENHGSYAPMYQESVGAYPGRNAIHFLLAGQRLPDVFTRQPNADALWRALRQLGAGAGLTAHPMVNDRYHLYGREVLPLTWRRLGQKDRYIARSEQLLIEHLEPYLLYPPENRLTKFSGEPKYEPEARAEVAMAYLLHRWRDRLSGDVPAVSPQSYWADVSGVRDYGAELGLLAHQSPEALALVVTKPNFVKFGYLPEHDDWLVDLTGGAPAFLPNPRVAVQGKSITLYRRHRDGIDATATVLALPTGYAGFATLPGGAVVYTSSGHSAGEGVLRLLCFDMPGVRGLDGDRTFIGAADRVTLTPVAGDGGVDELAFDAVQARHVRVLGARPATQFGYSLWSVEVFGPGSGDLAFGRAATASSFDPAFLPSYATDGDPATRWAVSRTDRPKPDSWLAVDLGSVVTIDRVRLSWETAYGAEYRIQVSADGVAWTDVVSVPESHVVTGDWVNVDDRAGFVVRGGSNPIRVTARSMTLSDGPAAGSAGLVVEGYASTTGADTGRAAARPAPVAPAGLTASTAGGQLSVFNLTGSAVSGIVSVPAAVLYDGSQTVAETTDVTVLLAAATAAVLPARFDILDPDGPLALSAVTQDRWTVRVTNTGPSHARFTLRCRATNARRRVVVPPGQTLTTRFNR
jgi:F5/8 type C domain-containing protein